MANAKVLIVDDAGFIRNLIKNHLAGKPIEIVGEAANGKDALELFKEKSPDIVTMDITMPEMDGLTCMSEMLKLRGEVKVLVITALSNKTTLLEAIQGGAAGYLAKPFKEERLVEEFDKILAAGG